MLKIGNMLLRHTNYTWSRNWCTRMLTIASDLKYPYGSYKSMKLIWEIWVISAFLHLMLSESDVFNFRLYGKMALKAYHKNNF